MKSPGLHPHVLLAAAACCLCAATARSQTTVIEADTFTTNPGTLQGRPVETPQTPGDVWNVNNSPTNNEIVGNGILTYNVLGSFSKGVAPFNASSLTRPYTLSYTLTFNPGNTTSNPNNNISFYGGIGNGTGNGTGSDGGQGFIDYSDALSFDVSGDTTGIGFELHAGTAGETSYQDQLSTVIFRDSTTDNYVIPLSITYDPTTDLADFFVSGTSIGTVSYSGPIAGLWFKGESISNANAPGYTGFQISDFSVTEAPEPSTDAMILVGVSFLGLAARRRRLI